jgi:chromodomain-helicase-DNA-binding protein 1
MPRDDKVAILKESLAAIGRRIEVVLEAKQAAGEDRDRWRRHLWTCVNELVSHWLGVFDVTLS